MNSGLPRQKFPGSGKIYSWLLMAYPRSHRAKYGSMMAQLFCDQCHDAWNESKNMGLLKLWLRVLPDLASTSIMEWFAAFKEGKSMNERIGSMASFGASPGSIFVRIFVPVFLFVVITSVVVTFILPEMFASTARIKIEQNAQADGKTAFSYDPYFIQTQFEIITSQAVLDPVNAKLHLNERWGKKYNAGKDLSSAESLEILRKRLSISLVRNTQLANITVYSDDSKEAAQIANAIAESYRDYRQNNSGWKSELPQPMLVQITDTAEPGRSPVKPNKTLNVVIGVVGGVFVASLLGCTAALIISIIRKRRQNAIGMA